LVAQTVGERALIPNLCSAWPLSQCRGHPRVLCRVAATPSCCVMPTFEPGWEAVSCMCRCLLRRARNLLAVLSLALYIFSSERRAAPPFGPPPRS
jgi:hypothetical protein